MLKTINHDIDCGAYSKYTIGMWNSFYICLFDRTLTGAIQSKNFLDFGLSLSLEILVLGACGNASGKNRCVPENQGGIFCLV